jgi:hypothetical protein
MLHTNGRMAKPSRASSGPADVTESCTGHRTALYGDPQH